MHDARRDQLAYQTVRRQKVYFSHGNIISCSPQDFICDTSLAVITSLINVPVELNSEMVATATVITFPIELQSETLPPDLVGTYIALESVQGINRPYSAHQSHRRAKGRLL